MRRQPCWRQTLNHPNWCRNAKVEEKSDQPERRHSLKRPPLRGPRLPSNVGADRPLPTLHPVQPDFGSAPPPRRSADSRRPQCRSSTAPKPRKRFHRPNAERTHTPRIRRAQEASRPIRSPASASSSPQPAKTRPSGSPPDCAAAVLAESGNMLSPAPPPAPGATSSLPEPSNKSPPPPGTETRESR
jgi:hypothetical protein